MGKRGIQFKPRTHQALTKTVSIETLDRNAKHWGKESQGILEVDLTKLGFTKVLSDGKLSHKLKVICHQFSEGAKKKIEAAGGSVIEIPGPKPVIKGVKKTIRKPVPSR